MTDDAFVNPQIEMQMYQSNAETAADYDRIRLQQSIDSTDGLLCSIQGDTDAIAALEAMATFIRGRDINKTSAILFNIAAEGYGKLDTVMDSRVTFALEGFREEDDKLPAQEIEVAMENLAKNTKEIIVRLQQSINKAMLAMGELVHSFDKNLLNLKKRLSALEVILESIKDKDEVAYNYVKPENSYTNLMYTEDGFTRGIKPVIDDINWLLNSHADMVSKSVGKYKDWLSQNKDDIENSRVIDSLDFHRDDFVLPGSTVFNRTVGSKAPAKGCAFYRTKELPGGKSLYVQVSVQNQHGTQAIDALSDLEYFIDYFEPDSFRITEKRLYSAAALGALAWASLMVASPLPLAMYGVANSHINDHTKTVDVKKVRITADTVFPTLSKKQLMELRHELKLAISSLERWNREVYVHAWKNRDIQDTVDSLTKSIEQSDGTPAGAGHIRRLAVALISLMGKSYTRVHLHSFTVLNAALGYAEKSARQYR